MIGGEEQSVLRLRLATLRRNLEQVGGTASSVAHRRSEVDALAELFEEQDGVQGTGGSLVRDIEECQKTVDELSRIPQVSPRLVERLRDRLIDCKRSVTDILSRAERSENIVRAMSSRWDTLSPDEKFDDHIKEIFAHRATALIKEIDLLAAEPPADAWSLFQKMIRAESEDLFSEYVEFLGGVALRDTGLGAPVGGGSADNAALNGGTGEAADQVGPDVYAMADDLIKQIYRMGGGDMWHSVTIPARRDAAARTLARMIRLRFPEWTVWAIPLAAYEFGRVVVNELQLVDAYADGFGGVEQGLETLLADVFAAYAMGPAYAFASVYVLLDPRAEGLEKLPDSRAEGREKLRERSPVRSDSERAYVVLKALELMDSGGALAGVIGELRTRWQMAVEQARGIAVPSGNDAETLDRIAGFLAGHLRDHALTIGYSASRWQSVQHWRPLGELLVDPKWRLTVGTEDVRDILNAAWLQRLNADEPLDVVADAELAGAALILWRRDLEGRRPGGGGIGQRWRK